MSKKLVRFFIFIFVISTITQVRADEVEPRHIFEERYAAMKDAMAKRDGGLIASLLAPNFVSTDTSGKTEDAEQMINEVKALPIDPAKVSKTTIQFAKINGNSASVEQTYDMKTKKAVPDGGIRDVELITTSKDTWLNSNGVWLLQSTTTEQMDYLINGQTVVHKVTKR